MLASTIIKNIKENNYQNLFTNLYQDETLVDYQNQRYQNALNKYISLFEDEDISIFSTAGRSEISGNHTDHQNGKVIAASINLDAIAICHKQDNTICIYSEDQKICEINYLDLAYRKEEENTSLALIRGVIYRLKELGYQIGGFKAYITSDVLVGSGMSSSACFEVLIGTIISGLYNDNKIDNVLLAKVAQYAENTYFNKPCGLMDQVACSIGGLVAIDFLNKDNPIIEPIQTDFSSFNVSLCIVDTKANHADLTDDYAAITNEMKKIANYFNKQVLSEVKEEDFYNNIALLREKTNDRCVLRAHHYFSEIKRVENLKTALNQKDFVTFKRLIKESGYSSYMYLQNIYTCQNPQNQALSIALSLSEKLLENHGVSRVHGGGFSGTIQAFVDNSYVDIYKREIEKIFGKNSCHILKIRTENSKQII